METKTVANFVYNDSEIEFSQGGKNGVMVNANTKFFIETCLKNGNSRFLNIQNERNVKNLY